MKSGRQEPRGLALGSVKGTSHGKLRSLTQELQRLQKASHQAGQVKGSITDLLVLQVGILQEAFVTLADTVVSELDSLRHEADRWQSDRRGWLTSIRELRQEANDKLLQVEQAQVQAQLEVQAAKTDMQAALLRQSQRLDETAQELCREAVKTRVDVQVLRNEVSSLQTLTSKDFPSEVLSQRMLDRETMEAAITQTVQEVVPHMVKQAAAREAPGAVQEQVGRAIRDVVAAQSDAIQKQVCQVVDQVSADVGSLTVDLAALSGTVDSLAGRAKALESNHGMAESRLTALESLELPLLGGLQNRLDAVSAQQTRYAQSMESVVRAIVDDAMTLAQTAERHELALTAHRNNLSETRDAVARCATVFSALLGVPSPVSMQPASGGVPG